MRALWLVVAFGLWGTVPALAEAPPRVDLGTTVVQAGDVAEVTLTLDAEGHPVAGFTSEIVFPTALSFVDAVAASAGIASAAEIRTHVKTAGSGAQTLVVKVHTPNGAIIPDGQIAILRFNVPKALDNDHSVDFRLIPRVTIVTPAFQTLSGEGDEGLITVLPRPSAVATCFFYMH